MKTCSPVRYALPSTSVTTAGMPATSASPTTRARNSDPTMLRCRSSSPRGSRPERSSSASRADVPLPHGERSTSPSAKTVTLRCVSGLSRLLLPEDHAVDVAELRLERVDDVLPRLDLTLQLTAELDQSRKLAGIDALLDRGVERPPKATSTVRSPSSTPSAQTNAGTFRKRTERTRPSSTCAQVSSRPEGTSTTTWFSPSSRSTHSLVERPRDERDRPVPARRRVARVVEEDDAEVGAVRRSARRRGSRTCPRGRGAR